MNETFLLYVLTRLDGIQYFLSLLSWVGCCALFIYILIETTEEGKSVSEAAGPYWIPLALCIILTLLVPSKDDAIFILAVTGVIEAAKTDSAKRIASKSVEVIEKYLDSILKEEK